MSELSLSSARDSHRDARVTLIAGPTTSGKSALAMRLARERGGVVVNADSMQVYAELRILTARPTAEDEAEVPHRLYGMQPAKEAYSVADWLRDVTPLIAAAREDGPPVIIAGGTGLYFKALLHGLSPVPAIPDDVRSHWRAEALRLGPADLHGELARRDPVMASRLRPSDPQRLARALEVLDGTGRSLSAWHEVAGKGVIAADEAEMILVAPPRAELYARCDKRFDGMIAAGALDEVRRLMALNLLPDRPASRALGVAPLMAHLRGELSFEAALERAKTDTRHYAKRQLTWASRNMIAWIRISSQ